MKAIPRNELLNLLNMIDREVIYETDVASLFNMYGDDYFKDDSWSPFVLCESNTLRKRVLDNISRKDDQQA